MTEAVFDFADINRRMNRKPEASVMSLDDSGNLISTYADGSVRVWNRKPEPVATTCATLSVSDLPEITPEYLGYGRPKAIADLRAELDEHERRMKTYTFGSNHVEDDGWQTLYAY